ncbi:hypothetical protein [Nostoc commune]|nr:hypothetical protein [Nostoc commune]
MGGDFYAWLVLKVKIAIALLVFQARRAIAFDIVHIVGGIHLINF